VQLRLEVPVRGLGIDVEMLRPARPYVGDVPFGKNPERGLTARIACEAHIDEARGVEHVQTKRFVWCIRSLDGTLPPRDASHESSSRKDGTAQKGRYSFQPRMREKPT